jgi:hypothetical protein
MKFSSITIAMALSLSKTVKLASAEGIETSSTLWEGEIGFDRFYDDTCTDRVYANTTNSTEPISTLVSIRALGNSSVCSTNVGYDPNLGGTFKSTVICNTTAIGLKGYEDHFMLSTRVCFDSNCLNCMDVILVNEVEPMTDYPFTPYSCSGPISDINLTTGEVTQTVYSRYYASPEVMAAYNKVWDTTCLGDYVKSSSSSSPPTDTEATTTTNENEGMLTDGSGAISGEEGGSSASITWGVSSFVVLAAAGLSSILFE